MTKLQLSNYLLNVMKYFLFSIPGTAFMVKEPLNAMAPKHAVLHAFIKFAYKLSMKNDIYLHSLFADEFYKFAR